jgi:SAM-dependent methyltransferase
MNEACKVCGGTLASHFPEVLDPLTHEISAIYKCRRCGLGHTLPQPQDLRPYYASRYYGNRHGFTLRYCIKRRLRFIDSVAQSGKHHKLLDIGCGDGSFLLAARGAGWDVKGTELNPGSAQESGLDVREGIDQFLGEGRFDCVTMWHTLEHMRDIRSILMRIAGLLKPNGKLLIAVPNGGSLQATMFRHKWLHLDVPRHLYHFDAHSLKYCLESAGYKIEHRWHQEFEYDLLGWSQSALNCIVPYPNVFLDYLTRKPLSLNRWMTGANMVLGSALTVLALPAFLAGTLLKQGGTIVVSARLA